MHWLVIYLVVIFSLGALIQAAQAGGWKPATKPTPVWHAFSAVCYALTAAAIALWFALSV